MSNGDNPLLTAIQQSDTTILSATDPARIRDNPLSRALRGGSPADGTTVNPLVSALRRTGQPATPPHPWGERHPILNAFVVEPIRDMAAAIKVGVIGWSEAAYDPLGATPRIAEYFARRASEDPAAAEEESRRALRGTAFLASFAGGPLVESAPVLGPLLGKWGSFLAGEALGGGIYGGVRPLEGDETRAQAIISDAAIFTAFGGVLKAGAEGASWALKRYMIKIPRARRIAAFRAYSQLRSRLDAALADGGVKLDQLPSDAAAALEEPMLRQAIHEADPSVKDLDAIVREQLDSEVETTTRMEGERPTVERLTPPIEIQFEEELNKVAPPLRLAPSIQHMTPEEIAAHPLSQTPSVAASAAAPGAQEAQISRVTEGILARERRVGPIRPDDTRAYVRPDLPYEQQPPAQPSLSEGERRARSVEDRLAAGRARYAQHTAETLLPGTQPFESPAAADVNVQNIAEKVAQPSSTDRLSSARGWGARHGTDVDSAIGIIESGLKRKSSVSLPGGRDYEGYAVTIEFEKPGRTTPYSSPLGPTAHEGAATTGSVRKDIKAVYLDTGDFVSREDAEEAYNRLREALDKSGRKDIPIQAAKFSDKTEKYSYGGPVTFEGVSSYRESLSSMSDSRLKRESSEAFDVLDGAVQDKNEALVKKYDARLGMIADEMDRRGLLPAMDKAEQDVKTAAIADAAVDHAVASVDPIRDTGSASVKSDASLVAQEIHEIPIRGERAADRLRGVLSAALDREGPAAEQGVLLNLTNPTPEQIVVEKAKARPGKGEVKARSALESSLEREKPLISIEPTENVSAPWMDKAEAESAVLPRSMDAFEMGIHLRDEQLDKLADELKNWGNRKGFITGRLLLVVTGSGMEWLSTSENLTEGEKTGLRAFGGLLIAAGIGPRMAEWFKTSKFTRKLLALYNPARIMSDPKAAELFRQYVENMTETRALGKSHGDVIRKIFSTDDSKRALMFVLDEGPSAPEWQTLTPAQQREATTLHQINLRLGVLLKAHGILEDFQENYVRHLMPPEAFQRWKLTGFKVIPTSGAFTKQRIFSLRELEQWAQTQGVPLPIMDPSIVHSYHLAESYRALGGVRLKEALEKIGLVVDAPQSGFAPIPDGWRPIKGVLNLRNKMAPDVVASALENIASSTASRSELVNSLDAMKSLWMRGIMFWFWEHGFNAMRSFVNLSMNPVAYADAYKFMKSTGDLDVLAARHGLDLFSRPDYGIAAHNQWQYLLGKVGLGKLGGRADKFFEWQDRILWDRMIPFLQKFTWAMEMHKWTERTGGRFLPGSAEFIVQARKAADFANTVAGRVPKELQDQSLARGMRLLLFSPQWTTTRISLLANAAGELGEIAAGRMNPADAMYLPFKMRQLAWGIGLTYLGSKLMSGKGPEFNPQTSKFYMRTGLRGADGREVGLDAIGWWQDDFRMFNHPLSYVFNRLNPALKIAQETLSGRDYLGRAMTTGQIVGNLATSFGPPAEAFADAYRLIQAAAGGTPISGAEGLQRATRLLATARTATLPRPIDVAISRVAKRILIKQGIPSNDDNIFELSRILRANVLGGGDLIDQRVITYLAYQRRSEIRRHPLKVGISGAMDFLWQDGRRVLADFD